MAWRWSIGTDWFASRNATVAHCKHMEELAYHADDGDGGGSITARIGYCNRLGALSIISLILTDRTSMLNGLVMISIPEVRNDRLAAFSA